MSRSPITLQASIDSGVWKSWRRKGLVVVLMPSPVRAVCKSLAIYSSGFGVEGGIEIENYQREHVF